MNAPRKPESDLMLVAEVAAAFRVDPKTVIRWAKAGKLEHIKTPTGHYRFHRATVRELLRRGAR